MLRLISFFSLAVFLLACAPAPTCDLVVEAPPIITVTDGSTQELICDATVVARRASDSAEFTLVTFVPPADGGGAGCAYTPASFGPDGGIDGFGGNLPDGVYTLFVSKPGYSSATAQSVASRSFSCDEPSEPSVRVNVVLTPT